MKISRAVMWGVTVGASSYFTSILLFNMKGVFPIGSVVFGILFAVYLATESPKGEPDLNEDESEAKQPSEQESFMEQDEVVALMRTSTSKESWNANIDKVKKACGGYPEFWYEAIIQSGLADEVVAGFGGTTDIEVIPHKEPKLEELKPLTGAPYNRPTTMPFLSEGQKVVGVYSQGFGEKILVCDTLADMQSLYDSYARGMALRLRWCLWQS